MRHTLFVLAFSFLLLAATPATAQLRQDVASSRASVKLYDTGGTGLSLNRFFSPQHFRMGHSVELTSGSGFGGGSMGMYTNTMMWQFNQKLAARVDVGLAYSPTQNMPGMSTTRNGSQVFLRNAEIAYRPRENMMLHLSVRQSPYGSYMSPYGRYGGAFSGAYGQYGFGMMPHSAESLFWNNDLP